MFTTPIYDRKWIWKIEELEEKENEIKASLETLSKGSISRETREQVLSPENYNLEMHKLSFNIVVDESTEWFKGKDSSRIIYETNLEKRQLAPHWYRCKFITDAFS